MKLNPMEESARAWVEKSARVVVWCGVWRGGRCEGVSMQSLNPLTIPSANSLPNTPQLPTYPL